ncbi:hypothetical protein [Paenirhodobacter populi]|uniref:Uncharacterized protein n=1 Tax=Paenirhodobacter populi TaxID=2306993 RepID=A0A443IYX9_9RHOB|nr:hypothetical protein [Sinirhodobacter populi]RWR13435.1 hypothetical protein D2T33_06945 [Sinirhodobacter populi]
MAELRAQTDALVAAAIERDGGTHDEDCKAMLNREPCICTCGRDELMAAIRAYRDSNQAEGGAVMIAQAPERIFANLAGVNGHWHRVGSWRDGERDDFSTYCNDRLGITEYRRADLPPTLAEALALPEIKALVEAASAERDARNLYLATAPDRGGPHGPKGQRKAALIAAQLATVVALRGIAVEVPE